MTRRFFGPTDGRRLQAMRAVRKLRALDFSDADILALLRENHTDRARPTAQSDDERPSKATRLKIAQWAISTLMALGFAEVEIANLVGVDHSTITHLLTSDGSRTVSRDTAMALRDAVHRAGSIRLKLLLGRLQIQILDTCCAKGRDLDLSAGGSVTEAVRNMIRNCLLLGSVPGHGGVPGIYGFLAQIGEPQWGMFLLGAPTGDHPIDADARIQQLRTIEHEIEHVLQRFRSERSVLERRRRRVTDTDVPDTGRIA